MNEHELSRNLENILVVTDSTKCLTHLKAIIIVVVGTLQIPNQYKQNGKSSTLGSFFD